MIPSSFPLNGYATVPSILAESKLSGLRREASRLTASEGSACIRNLRSKSEVFRALSFGDLLPKNMVIVRSILFDKTPRENWPVAWHQDLTIAVARQIETPDYGPWSVKDGVPHVQPPVALLEKMITLRLHLDDTPPENGALRVIPGSHQLGKLPSAQVKDHTHTSPHICSSKAGDILLMSPLILHASSRAQTPSHRRVIHLEFAPSDTLHQNLNWHEQNA